jgi:AraC-like DNA-binding protein
MLNFYEKALEHPDYYRQFKCNETLITAFNCPLEAKMAKTKFTDLWTKHNYILYVFEGRKMWHTPTGSYDVKQGSCIFVRKGAHILEQFFESGFCVLLFFVPDEFIRETLQSRSKPIIGKETRFEPVFVLEESETLRSFFVSMSAHFGENKEPDSSLLELKFKELILTIADDPRNTQLLSYFCSLMNDPQSVSMQRVMDENFCFNLKLEEYAELCNRSLSAFKRDFQKVYNTTPGKWLSEKRLNHAMLLLTNRNKTVSEAAFESGFENASHFSRSFKERFGVAPASVKRRELISA